jgi:ribonucleoside-diphosphate reductase alpha chain
MRFEPAGLTDDPDVRMAASIMDYIFRRLALDFLPFEERAALGVFTAQERARQLETGSYQPLPGQDADLDTDVLAQSAPREEVKAAEPAAELASTEPASPEPATLLATPATPGGGSSSVGSTGLIEAQQGRTADAPLCFTCGTKMRPAGSCYVCEGCGSTSGCS